jgi:hypothetical protein
LVRAARIALVSSPVLAIASVDCANCCVCGSVLTNISEQFHWGLDYFI